MPITDIHISIASFRWKPLICLRRYSPISFVHNYRREVMILSIKVYQSDNWKEAFLTLKRTVSCLYCPEWRTLVLFEFRTAKSTRNDRAFFSFVAVESRYVCFEICLLCIVSTDRWSMCLWYTGCPPIIGALKSHWGVII